MYNPKTSIFSRILFKRRSFLKVSFYNLYVIVKERGSKLGKYNSRKAQSINIQLWVVFYKDRPAKSELQNLTYKSSIHQCKPRIT